MLGKKRIEELREMFGLEGAGYWVQGFAEAVEREAIANFLNESGQYLTNDASREAAICEATVPLIKQIKEDESLMRDVLEVLEDLHENHNVTCAGTLSMLRQRLEAKK